MPFISYAQNYEDVILWRALRDLERGFYVDLGAADPEELSVTRAFYERGWSGINVEPQDGYFDKLKQARPRDTNLKVAVGREVGLRTLHTVAGTGLSTLDPAIAAQHRAAGWEISETSVPVVTLEKILEDCAPPTIHFLKIDVEGAEAEVLQGLKLELTRPWIIVVEATKPFSNVSTRQEWEHLIISHGYSFAYFDGLNCFYVADEFDELKERLGVPPNVFDDFVRWSEWSSRQKALDLENQLELSRNGLQAERKFAAYLHDILQAERDRIDFLSRALQAEQAQVANLTNALQVEQAQVAKLELQLALPSIDRALGRVARRLGETYARFTNGGVRQLANRVLTTSLLRSLSFASRHPRLAALPRGILKPFPKLIDALNQSTTPPGPPAAAATVAEILPLVPEVDPEPSTDPIVEELPALARTTYLKLQTAIFNGGDSPHLP
jgi:FkbM family methyltransferase